MTKKSELDLSTLTCRRNVRLLRLFYAYGHRLEAEFPFTDAERTQRIVTAERRPLFERYQRRTHELLWRLMNWGPSE